MKVTAYIIGLGWTKPIYYTPLPIPDPSVYYLFTPPAQLEFTKKRQIHVRGIVLQNVTAIISTEDSYPMSKELKK